jgi:hypothetical protein
MIRIDPKTASLSRASTVDLWAVTKCLTAKLHTAALRGTWRCRTRRERAARSGLILRRTFGLHALGNKASIGRQTAFDQGLRFIHESVWQWIAAGVTYGERFPFPIQHKINASGEFANRSRFHRAANAHPVSRGRAMERRNLGNRVVIRLALAVTEPRQEPQRSHNYSDTDAEFSAFLQEVCL